MSDYKESDERDQISKDDEETVTGDIEVLKLGKLSSQKNIDNIEKESDEINWMDMSDDEYSNERYHIIKHNEEIVTDDIEVFNMVELSSKKNDDNIEKEYYGINWIDMSYDKDSDERYHMDKNDLKSD